MYSPQQQLAQTPVESKKLGKDFVIIGELGVPLGTVVEINATIVAGRTLGWKDIEIDYLLKVTRVGTNSISKPPTCEFYTHSWDDLKIARDEFSLYELKNGKKAENLSNKQVAELERGYVGRAYHLLVYEEGMFTGIPEGLPKGYMVWQDRSFGFRSHLIVLRILEEPEKSKLPSAPSAGKSNAVRRK